MSHKIDAAIGGDAERSELCSYSTRHTENVISLVYTDQKNRGDLDTLVSSLISEDPTIKVAVRPSRNSSTLILRLPPGRGRVTVTRWGTRHLIITRVDQLAKGYTHEHPPVVLPFTPMMSVARHRTYETPPRVQSLTLTEASRPKLALRLANGRRLTSRLFGATVELGEKGQSARIVPRRGTIAIKLDLLADGVKWTTCRLRDSHPIGEVTHKNSQSVVDMLSSILDPAGKAAVVTQ